MTSTATGDSRRPVGDIVDKLDSAVADGSVSVRSLLQSFGPTSFVPVLVVPALLVVSPLSGIPLFSTICGLTIAFISAQMLLGRDHIWLPDILMRQRIDGEKAHQALSRVRRVTDWLDGKTRHRLSLFLRTPFRQWLHLLCFVCGAAMPFLELVPFSSSILGGAVLLFSTSLLARDGLFAVLGSLLMGAAALVPLAVLGVI